MNLKLSDLRAFLDKASTIKTSAIIPVLGYIRFKDGLITKSDSTQYISMRADFEGEALIDSHVLSSYVSRAKGDITLTRKGNKITLTDGFIPVTSPTEDIINYPLPEAPNGVAVELSEEVCRAIGTCSAPVTADEIAGAAILHVFIGNGAIIGTSQVWGLRIGTDDNLPKAALRKIEAEMVGKLPGCTFQQSSHWHFYSTQNFTYGVIKSEAAWRDITGYYRQAAPAFTLQRTDLFSFCDTVVATCPGKDLLTSMEAQGGTMTLRATDPAYGVDVVREVPCEADVALFGFQPVNMLRILKGLPADEYEFCPGKDMYHLAAGNKVGLIMRMELKTQ